MKGLSPNWLKNFARFIVYKNQRKKVFREPSIKRLQNQLLLKDFDLKTEKLIVFVVDGADWFTGKDKISGGILSIASIYEETLKLVNIHKSEVIMVTAPDAHLLLKHEEFPNEINVFRVSQLNKFTNLSSVIVHVPEYMVNQDVGEALQSQLCCSALHLNILNQRYDLMPSKKVIENLKIRGWFVTQTTAHEQYSTQEFKDKFEIPLHKLSVFARPERYTFLNYADKENIIAISPDDVPIKQNILEKIERELPGFKVFIIKGLKYLDYLELVKKSKFMITFGEGLDFYFIETVFSGGVSFAVYNSEFFTEDFENLEGIFDSYENMLDLLIEEIKNKDNLKTYEATNGSQFKACYKIYNGIDYQNNIIEFYKENYTFS